MTVGESGEEADAATREELSGEFRGRTLAGAHTRSVRVDGECGRTLAWFVGFDLSPDKPTGCSIDDDVTTSESEETWFHCSEFEYDRERYDGVM